MNDTTQGSVLRGLMDRARALREERSQLQDATSRPQRRRQPVESFFTPAVARQIIAFTGERLLDADEDALSEELQDALQTFAWRRSLEDAPTSKQVVDLCMTLTTSLNRVLGRIGIADGQDIRDANPQLFEILCGAAEAEGRRVGGYRGIQPTRIEDSEELDYGGAAAVLAATYWLQQMAEWSTVLSKNPPAAFDFDGELPILRWFICELLGPIYERHSGRKLGVSRPGDLSFKSEYGPFVRFVQASLAAWGYEQKGEAIIKTVQRWRAASDT
jgi:hypothetical protein